MRIGLSCASAALLFSSKAAFSISTGKGILNDDFIDNCNIGSMDGKSLAVNLEGNSNFIGCSANKGKIYCRVENSSPLAIRDLNKSLQNVSSLGRIFTVEGEEDSKNVKIKVSFKPLDEVSFDVAQNPVMRSLQDAKNIALKAESSSFHNIESRHPDVKRTINVLMNDSKSMDKLDKGECLFTYGLDGCTAIIVQASNSDGEDKFFLSHQDNPYMGKLDIERFIKNSGGQEFKIFMTSANYKPERLISDLESFGSVSYEKQDGTSCFGILRNDAGGIEIVRE